MILIFRISGYLFCLDHVSVMPFNSFGLIFPYSELEEGKGAPGFDHTVGWSLIGSNLSSS